MGVVINLEIWPSPATAAISSRGRIYQPSILALEKWFDCSTRAGSDGTTIFPFEAYSFWATPQLAALPWIYFR